MKKYLSLVLILAGIKFIIHAFGNFNYGFQRDELLHLSVGQHLDWGFMEFPPFIGVLGSAAHHFFNDNLWLTRLFPTLAGIAILFICCCIAIETGGKSKAVFLSGICVLAFLPFYRNHTLFQPVAFEQLFWTLGFFFVVRYTNTTRTVFLYLLAFTAAVAVLNKYTSILWIVSISIGLLFYNKASIYKQKDIYLAGMMALIIISPNIIWQFNHNLPILKHLEALRRSQLDEISPLQFVADQAQFVFTFIITLIGVFGIFFMNNLKRFRAAAISFLVLFFLMWLQGAKGYYFFGAYPVMFAAGAVVIEQLLTPRPVWIYVIGVTTFLSSVYYIPMLTPILPIERFVAYTSAEETNGRVELTSDYADMFGWEEQVKLIDSVYKSLSLDEQKTTTIFASNYGEAGAVKILGASYGLPNPICVSGTFWLWGPGNPNATTFICIGFDDETISNLFEDATLVKVIRHRYVVEEENNITLYICRNPKERITTLWPSFEKYVFE